MSELKHREQTSNPLSYAQIFLGLIELIGNLSLVIVAAVALGSLGFILALSTTGCGVLALASMFGLKVPFTPYQLLICGVAAGVLRGCLRYGEQYSNHFIAFKLLARIRDRVFATLRDLAPAKLEGQQRGDLISLITADIETLEVFYAHTLSPLCIALVVNLSVALFLAYTTHPLLALFACMSYVLVGALIPWYATHATEAVGKVYRGVLAGTNSYMLESMKGVRELTLYGALDQRAQGLDERSYTLAKLTEDLKLKSIRLFSLSELAVGTCNVLFLLLALLLNTHDMITQGQILLGWGIFVGSFGPVLALAALPQNLAQTFASARRVLALMAEKPAVSNPDQALSEVGIPLAVREVQFSYESRPYEQILKEASLTLSPGEIIGIVGPSGCGKSTLLKLLLRFWDKSAGSISYGDHEITSLSLEALHEQVTLVSQETYLFEMSIADNLRLAKPDATDEELIAATQKASLHDDILELSDGYDTQVSMQGNALSAGQRQRLGLARAFLRNAPYILLDEVTSNIDSLNEGIILKSLQDARQDHALILVSHRESTMAIADRVFEIHDGVLKERMAL